MNESEMKRPLQPPRTDWSGLKVRVIESACERGVKSAVCVAVRRMRVLWNGTVMY